MLIKKTAMMVIMLAISGSTVADLNTGLVARWTFDNCDGKDVTGRGHGGVLYGSSTTCVPSPGNNNAFLFNGIDSYFRINPSPDFSVGTQVSYAAWVKPTRLPDSGHYTVLFNKLVGGYEDKWLGIFNGKAFFYLFDCMNRRTLNSTIDLPINKWTYIVATYDGTAARLYINGALNISVATQPQCNVNDSTGYVYLGDAPNRRAEPPPAATPLDGAMDDMRVYNRALSSSEVQQLYFQVVPPKISGTAPWVTPHTITCKNMTTNKQITIPATSASAWNCEAAGLQFKSGDTVKVIIDGKKY